MKCGASGVYLQELPIGSLLEMQRTLFAMNGLSTDLGAFRQVTFKWGTFPLDFVKEAPEIGLFMAADCIYDKNDFDDLVATIAFFLDKFRNVPLVMCYQDRNLMYSIIEPLDFWGLKAALIPVDSFGFDPEQFASLNDLTMIQDFPTESLDKVIFLMEVRRIDENFTFVPL
ncbi:hypothetical protein PSACC_00436 [Paramicrosporidium saccamoebae]|uniref:Uncharacterized protein n=1 Tax=Paramicrosporidium saccamoebae TaxID=1246581 RepID=A0A2H9TPV5_9FUNG|nr:hypothetical protein PSACC_00436 [Paramicrosporidium saccamoebae]